MEIRRKIKFKKVLTISFWVLLGAAGIALMTAAITKKSSSRCSAIGVQIINNDSSFVSQNEIIYIIERASNGKIIGKPINEIDLFSIENAIKKEAGIFKAELFFDNHGKLNVIVHETRPIARIFTTGGNSFFIDGLINILPANKHIPTQMPIITNFPSELNNLNAADSSLLKDINALSIDISKDAFLSSLIEQISINSNRQFELIPKVGEQIIILGDASDLNKKLNKLKLFYKKIVSECGLDKYDLINLQFKGQIVAKLKGVKDPWADSLQTIQNIDNLANYSARLAADTLKMNAVASAENGTLIIENSAEREVIAEGSEAVQPIPSVVKVTPAQESTVIQKTIIQKPIVLQPNTNNIKPVQNNKGNVASTNKPKAVVKIPVVVKPKMPTAPKPILKQAVKAASSGSPKENDY
ncbi:MAG: hypothetical protein FGM46_07795 [Ferruginibacter sp.]|nr:hypothetical protein [Ferruginibacter sp.]